MAFLNIAFNIPFAGSFTYQEPSGQRVSVGCRVKAFLGKRLLSGWVVARSQEVPPGVKGIKEVKKILDQEPLFGEELLSLAHWTSSFYHSSLGETLAAMLPGGQRETALSPGRRDSSPAAEGLSLTGEQDQALKTILSPQDGISYLYGVTGSGKTEVFLQAARQTLEEGRGVIYLVPEIALSHQLAEDLSSRFSQGVAVLHSGLTPSQRLTEWRRLLTGKARVALGARSAVFAPVQNLGLVVLDEEHEGTYKSSSSPRYHARQVAMRRCRLAQARLVMGSATPSVEAWSLMRENRLTRLTLAQRPAGGAPPRIQVVDMKKEKNLFSRPLAKTMGKALAQGRQILLFLNRRGFSYFFSCNSCGEEIRCRRCSVPLTLHKRRESSPVMICHYCGYRRTPPPSCPSCHSLDVGYAGFGTEKAEEEAARLFPDKSIARLDGDVIRKKGVLEKTLKDFREGRIDMLLGTQVVAKGLNAPGVKLAAVLLADTSLNLPDFRASERTFGLITQVAGRAGRFAPDGEVIVQTFRPEDKAVHLAAAGRWEEFYAAELDDRKSLGFPPYSRLFRVVARGKEESKVRLALENFSQELNRTSPGGEILGPAECPLGRIADSYRRHLILRTRTFDQSHAALALALQRSPAPRGVHYEIDIDPVALL